MRNAAKAPTLAAFFILVVFAGFVGTMERLSPTTDTLAHRAVTTDALATSFTDSANGFEPLVRWI